MQKKSCNFTKLYGISPKSQLSRYLLRIVSRLFHKTIFSIYFINTHWELYKCAMCWNIFTYLQMFPLDRFLEGECWVTEETYILTAVAKLLSKEAVPISTDIQYVTDKSDYLTCKISTTNKKHHKRSS